MDVESESESDEDFEDGESVDDDYDDPDYEAEREDEISDIESIRSNSSADGSESETLDGIWSKDKKIFWQFQPQIESQARVASENIIPDRPGVTQYAVARIHDKRSTFDLFFTDAMKKSIVEYTNKNGQKSIRGWNDIDVFMLDGYIGLLLLAGITEHMSDFLEDYF